MSLDERLREGLGRMSADVPPEPIDVGSDLQGVLVAGRRRRALRQAYRGIAVVALLLIALAAGPNLFRQLGLQEVETADDPPASERDKGLGTKGDSSEKGGFAPGSLGTGGPGGGSGQGGPGAGAPRQGVKVAGTSPPTPVPAGNYSYDVEGKDACDIRSCDSFKQLDLTFDPPNGSHQRSAGHWRHAQGGRYEDETSYDYRPDGVYLESYRATYTNSQGAVTFVWACSSLPAPVRVWPTGAKPGDHFEYTGGCDANIGVNDQGTASHTSTDILRAETVSIGGREVATLLVRTESYNQEDRYRFWQGWVFPDHYLSVKDHNSWSSGEFWRTLKSMTPS